MKKIVLLSLLCLGLVGCELEDYYKDLPENDKKSQIDVLFINGCQLQVEQVYIMSGKQTIPYLDIPIDSCFKNSSKTVSLNNFTANTTDNFKIFDCLSKNEKWTISKMFNINDTTYIERGWGNDYYVSEFVKTTTYNEITRENPYSFNKNIINYKLNDIYTYRGIDNHVFNFINVNIETNQICNSNLFFSILTDKKGLAITNGGNYIYFDTNYNYKISYQITAPLTGNEVKNQIANGNYTLYLWKGMTTYKIGNNLYIPRYNSYVYVGEVNTTGSIINFEQTYYRFKFKIIK